MVEKLKYLLILFFVSCFGGVSAQKQEKPKKLEFTVEGITFEMILVEGGRFMMGDEAENDIDCYEDEAPIHRVTLADFYIGKLEVTQELWRAVMHYNPSHFRGYKNPVENISWEDCQLFINRLNKLLGQNFRLPTEAEWEYAARGGKYSKGYKYSGSNNIDDVAWYEANTTEIKHHCRAGTKQPNELGLYDMSGNVWEWCQDFYDLYEPYPLTNPIKAQGMYKVLRGGCNKGVARSCRITNRSSNMPEFKGIYYGFRLAIYQ